MRRHLKPYLHSDTNNHNIHKLLPKPNSQTQTQKSFAMTSFTSFYKFWFLQLKIMVKDLKEEHSHEGMEKVLRHHGEYYKEKWIAMNKDPLSMFTSPWNTNLERSLHWITGWRPTTAFHLIYTESSLLFETHIIDILHGLRTGDLGDLNPSQFRYMSDLQCDTVSNTLSLITFKFLILLIILSG